MKGKDARDAADHLFPWAIRFAAKVARDQQMEHAAGDLRSLVVTAVIQAIDAFDRDKDPTLGTLKPYVKKCVTWRIRDAVDEEREIREHELPLDEAAAPRPMHPELRAEDAARDLYDDIVALYMSEELRSQGEPEMLRREAHAALHREVERLPPRHRVLIELRYSREATWAEVGEALGIRAEAARKLDERIRKHLYDALIHWDRVRPIGGPP